MIYRTVGITAFFIILMLPFCVYSSVLSFLDQKKEAESQDLQKLQDKCEQQCKELYKHFDSKRVPTYQHYYNEKLNKCFVIISNKKNTEKYLYEVDDNETKIRGIFLQVGSAVEFCLVSNRGCQSEEEEDTPVKSYTRCKSLSEWNKLVQPYMEE
jgi:hypothetical protein